MLGMNPYTPVRCLIMVAAWMNASSEAGGRAGSSPARRNNSRLYARTLGTTYHGMPYAFPPFRVELQIFGK